MLPVSVIENRCMSFYTRNARPIHHCRNAFGNVSRILFHIVSNQVEIFTLPIRISLKDK